MPSRPDGRALALLFLTAAAPPVPPLPPSRAAAVAPENERPPYVISASTSWRGAPSWLILGLEQRFRYEGRCGRVGDRPGATDLQFGLSRSRLFLGIVPETAPVKLLFEAQDARQLATDLPETSDKVNEVDVLQLRVGLDLERCVRAPVRIEAGRSSYDAIDRRLLARNRFRNATNAFDGLRLELGRQGSARGAEFLALFPTERRSESVDLPEGDRRLLGVLGRWTAASTTLEPYYLFYRVKSPPRQSLHTAGAHLFGTVDGGRLDHDFDFAFQGGTDGARPHRAFAIHAELGRRFHTYGSPRLAVWINYATGDRDPDDDRSERFDPLFGASHSMYGFTDLFGWQNTMSPTVAVSLRPKPAVRAEVLYRLYWLASSRDAFVRAGLIDPTGKSGSFVGQGIDAAIRYRVSHFAEIEIQYGELVAGSFVDRAGGARGNRGARVLFASVVLATGGR